MRIVELTQDEIRYVSGGDYFADLVADLMKIAIVSLFAAYVTPHWLSIGVKMAIFFVGTVLAFSVGGLINGWFF